MQYHFVVVYDENEDKFFVDDETCYTRFGDELAFDGEWQELDELMENDYIDYGSMLTEKLRG